MNELQQDLKTTHSENDESDQELEQVNRLRKSAERLIVRDDGPNANLFDTAKFEQCYRVAKAMAAMSLLPEHLRFYGPKSNRRPLTEQQIIANCFRIVNQAVRWGMDPYAIVDETYVVAGKLGYQGKLVAAVVNARAGLSGRLDYSYCGQGDDRTICVSGTFEGDDKPREIELRVRDAKTSNEMWTKDPDQKLVYSGATKWARRHCPEVVLGVLTDDDLQRIGETVNVEYEPERTKGKRVHVSSLADEAKETEVDVPRLDRKQYEGELDKATTIGEVDVVLELTTEQAGDDASKDLVDFLEFAANQRKQQIRDSRGQKSN